MIVVGISPGLGALAYSALGWSPRSPDSLDALDSDIIHAGRQLKAGSALQIARRCRAHHLMLDVVFGRYPPAIVAIGPQLNRRELPEHVAAIRVLIQGISMALTIPLYDFGDRKDLLDALDAKQKGLAWAVDQKLNGSLGSRDRRIVLATGAALAAINTSRREEA